MLHRRVISSFVTRLDEKRMSAIKRLLLGNFTINSFLRQDSELDQTISSLVKYLEDNKQGMEWVGYLGTGHLTASPASRYRRTKRSWRNRRTLVSRLKEDSFVEHIAITGVSSTLSRA